MLIAEKPPLDEDLLAHYGIKGMKWGMRKAKEVASAPARRIREKGYDPKKVAKTAAVVGAVGYLATRPATRGASLALIKKSVSIGSAAAGKVLRGVGHVAAKSVRPLAIGTRDLSTGLAKGTYNVTKFTGQQTYKAGRAVGRKVGKTAGWIKPPPPKPIPPGRIHAAIARGKAFFAPRRVDTLDVTPMSLVSAVF